MASPEGTRIVGIDLGTTLSSVAYMDEHGAAVTIPNAEGDLTTPSVILFEADGDVVVGREARRAALVEPDRVVDCVKRDMGEASYHRPVAGKAMSPVAASSPNPLPNVSRNPNHRGHMKGANGHTMHVPPHPNMHVPPHPK